MTDLDFDPDVSGPTLDAVVAETRTGELTESERRELDELTKFLERIRTGCGPLNAGLEIGWSPAKIRRMENDPEIAELIAIAIECRLEGYEQTLHNMAARGHFKALQMVLYNLRSERWRDVRHIRTTAEGALDVNVVIAVKRGALELLREQGVAALQPGMVIDATTHDVDDDT